MKPHGENLGASMGDNVDDIFRLWQKIWLTPNTTNKMQKLITKSALAYRHQIKLELMRRYY